MSDDDPSTPKKPYRPPEQAEKRGHARIAAPLDARLVEGASETELAVREFSLGGIFLYTRAPPGPAGTSVSLRLALTQGIKPLLVHGKIVRVVNDPKGGVLGIAVKFDGGIPEDERNLRALLDRSMTGRGTHNRAYPRVCYLLEVVCRTRAEVKALLLDIGEGGVGLNSQRSFEKDEAIVVEIGTHGSETLKLAGWVVSNAPVPGKDGTFRVGVRFGKLSPEVRKALKEFLEALYRR